MNRKTLWIVFAIAVSFAFSKYSNAQSPAPPEPKTSVEAKLIKKEIAAVQQQVVAEEKRMAIVKREIEETIERLREESVSDIGYEDVFRMLQIQKVELKIELEGLKARMELLQKKVANETGEENEAVKTQRENLKRYIANQKTNLENVKTLAKKGFVSSQEKAKAEQMLADAELRLKQFEVKARQAPPKYVEAMFETTLAIAERKAKLETVSEMLGQYIKTRKDISSLKEFRVYQDSLRSYYVELLGEINKLTRTEAKF